jgi:hypothetical protein
MDDALEGIPHLVLGAPNRHDVYCSSEIGSKLPTGTMMGWVEGSGVAASSSLIRN